MTQPQTEYPPEDPPPKGQIIARMATIPHGNSVPAQGSVPRFTGAPTLPKDGSPYNGSVSPSLNGTPFPVGVSPTQVKIKAADSSEKPELSPDS